MDKKSINLDNLEIFLEKAKSKLEEGIEDIGENNMNKLANFLSEIRNEKSKKIISNNENTLKMDFEAEEFFDFEKFKMDKNPNFVNDNIEKIKKAEESNSSEIQKSKFKN
jgi:hypothetical protein